MTDLDKSAFMPISRPTSGVRLTVAEIQRVVAAYFDLSPSDLVSPRRDRALCWPRQMAMALAVEQTGLSLPAIGQRFGGRDHTTVLHARRIVARRRADLPEYDRHMRALEALLSDICPDYRRRDMARGMFRTRRLNTVWPPRGAGRRVAV